MNDTVKLGKYRHSKSGEIYYVLMLALNANSDRNYVVYCNEKDEIFTRPASEYIEMTEYGTRFEYLGTSTELYSYLQSCFIKQVLEDK